MSEPILTSERAIAGTRGKYHRLSDYGETTACGKWARDMHVAKRIGQTAPEDRCRKCWPADRPPVSGQTGDPK